jgi:hypothetical protein
VHGRGAWRHRGAQHQLVHDARHVAAAAGVHGRAFAAAVGRCKVKPLETRVKIAGYCALILYMLLLLSNSSCAATLRAAPPAPPRQPPPTPPMYRPRWHRLATARSLFSSGSRQGLILLHFSAQPEPFFITNALKPPTEATRRTPLRMLVLS